MHNKLEIHSLLLCLRQSDYLELLYRGYPFSLIGAVYIGRV